VTAPIPAPAAAPPAAEPAGDGPPPGPGLTASGPASLAPAPPGTLAPPAIVLCDVSRVFKTGRGWPPWRRGQFTAVSRLSLTVPPAVVFGLLGPNGSGKTTTINMITGLIPPTSGTAQILGRDARRNRAVRGLLGVVPQDTALYGELTARGNLENHADLYGIPRREQAARIADVLAMVSLTDRASDRVSTFSGGQQRRLAIARALLHEPAVIVLDEPTLGIDPHARAAIWGYIRDLAAGGKTVLLTTNYLEEAAALCDQVAIIDHGRLVTVGTPAELQRDHGRPSGERAITAQVRATTGVLEEVQAALRAMDGVRDVTAAPTGRPGEHTLQVTTYNSATAAEAVAVIAQRCTVQDLDAPAPSLDEVFLALTGTGLRD
jgi:ABC-2 type transport system ATP-binding protein